MRVVVLHPDTVRAGDHHSRIVGALVGGWFEDDSRLGPRCKPRLLTIGAGSKAVARAVRSRKRRESGREGAVAGEWLVYERVSVGNGFAVWTDRHRGITPVACQGGYGGPEHEHDRHRQERDHPQPGGAKIGEFSSKQLDKVVTAHHLLGTIWNHLRGFFSCSRSGLAGSVRGNLPDVAVWISEPADLPEFVDL